MMRKNRILSILLVLSLLLCSCGSKTGKEDTNEKETAATEAPAGGEEAAEKTETAKEGTVTLTEKGSITDEEKQLELDEDIPTYEDGEKSYLLSGDGVKTDMDLTNRKVDDLSWDYFMATDPAKTEKNCVGLYTKSGEELLPCEAAGYDFCEDSSRYMLVRYIDKETTNKEEAVIYETNDMISFSPGEDDTLYTGVIKVYDCEKRKLVPNVQYTTPYEEILACGDSVLIQDRKNGTVEQYSSDGQKLNSFSNIEQYSLKVGDGVFAIQGDDVGTLYNDGGQMLLEGTENLHCSSDLGKYATDFQQDVNILYDNQGTKVFEDKSLSVNSVHNGVMTCFDGQKYCLAKLDGTKVSDMVEEDLEYMRYGYWSSKLSDGTYGLFNKDGKVASLEKLPQMVNHREADGNEQYMVLSTGQYSVTSAEDVYMAETRPIAVVKDASTSLYGLTELFGGTELLPKEYTEIEFMNGYIYAYKDAAWQVYQVNFPEE